MRATPTTAATQASPPQDTGKSSTREDLVDPIHQQRAPRLERLALRTAEAHEFLARDEPADELVLLADAHVALHAHDVDEAEVNAADVGRIVVQEANRARGPRALDRKLL